MFEIIRSLPFAFELSPGPIRSVAQKLEPRRSSALSETSQDVHASAIESFQSNQYWNPFCSVAYVSFHFLEASSASPLGIAERSEINVNELCIHWCPMQAKKSLNG